jgi:hypothetical protein
MANMDNLFAVAYTTDEKSKLRYAEFEGNMWLLDLVDPAPVASKPVSLIELEDEPAIAFIDDTDSPRLRFASLDESKWNAQTLDPEGRSYTDLEKLVFNPDVRESPVIAYQGSDGSDGDLKYAQLVRGEWRREIVDSEGDVGKEASLTIFAERPAICYIDNSDGRSILKYARFELEGWRIEHVADWASGADLVSIQGVPSIAYAGVGGLIYSSRDGDGTWPGEVVSEAAASQIVLRVIADLPEILFLEDSAKDVVSVKIVRFDGQEWRFETVADDAVRAPISIVYVGNGPAVAYFGLNSSTSLHELRLATPNLTPGHLRMGPRADAGLDLWVNDDDGDGLATVRLDASDSIDFDGEIVDYSWTTDGAVIAEGIAPSVDLPRGVHDVELTVTDDLGFSSSNKLVVVAVHSAVIDDSAPIQMGGPMLIDGQPALVYGAGAIAKYSRFNGSVWQTTTLDYPISISDESDKISLIDIEGLPVLAQGPTFTSFDGDVWETVVVDADSSSVGAQTLSVVDGAPAIAYVDFNADEIKYAVLDGLTWRISTVDRNGAPRNPSLLVVGGQPIIAYDADPLDGGNREIRCARPTVDQWFISTVESDGRQPSLADIEGVQTAFAYRSDSTGHINYTTFDGMDWRTETVDASVFSRPILEEVGDGPAVAYVADETAIRYVWRDGNEWRVTVLIEEEGPITNLGFNAIDGKPMIAYESQRRAKFLTLATGTFNETAPLADAGDGQLVCETDADGSEEVMLDGSRTRDIDGDAIESFIWTDAGGDEVATGAAPVVTLPLGFHWLTLTASDGNGNSGSDQVGIMVGTAPIADAGTDQMVIDPEANGSELVQLSGVGSSDADGTIVVYEWFEGPGNPIATGESPSVNLTSAGSGEHTIRLVVTDNNSCTAEDTVVVVVQSFF